MSWAEVKKINDNLTAPLDVQLHQQALLQNMTEASIDKVLNLPKNVGRIINGALGLGSAELAALDTWSDIVSSAAAMAAITGNEQAMEILTGSTMALNAASSTTLYACWLNRMLKTAADRTALLTHTAFDVSAVKAALANTTYFTASSRVMGGAGTWYYNRAGSWVSGAGTPAACIALVDSYYNSATYPTATLRSLDAQTVDIASFTYNSTVTNNTYITVDYLVPGGVYVLGRWAATVYTAK